MCIMYKCTNHTQNYIKNYHFHCISFGTSFNTSENMRDDNVFARLTTDMYDSLYSSGYPYKGVAQNKVRTRMDWNR